ncbi:transglutaminase-like domain-containing protein [Geminocystis herdmanii]|uniref:transglutaminase-like domain-containing protein n=1 Tax=Geminocystis herdmanii TaxID=669359 RepID=UPI000346A4E2|nr:transglutaminase family protein [Geminocystis herdmanii]
MTNSSTPKFYPTIRPIVATYLDGICFKNQKLFAIDSRNGYLLSINPQNSITKIINSSYWQDFIGAKGLCITDDKLWFTNREEIYVCTIAWEEGELKIVTPPQFSFSVSYSANGIAIWENTLYITTQKTGHILVYSVGGDAITKFYAPGIGYENITVKGEEIWLCDNLEQTVYCVDKVTGKVKYNMLTPFEYPTALSFYHDDTEDRDILYIAYSDQEPYIRDNPNAEPNHELLYRDRTFIHPLYFKYDEANKQTLSNGFLLEVTYLEEIAPLDSIEFKDLEWRIALPTQSDRQKIKSIEAVGLPYIEEDYNGQKVALFKFPKFTSEERFVFGWRAVLEVWSIKYQIKPRDCESLPPLPLEFEGKYLIDDDDLSMSTDVILRGAEEARGSETNILRKMYNIRNYVYDHLTYGIKPHIDTPDIVLKRGTGSCGEYLGLLLALSRLNGIACRTVGRYKCPMKVLQFGVPLVPDFNHVWMEFYIPTIGWLPMESNPDDLDDGGPYPTRFFMGLSWYHVEMAKDVPFETLISEGLPVSKEKASIGQLAINHVSFTIVEELQP